MFDYKKKNDASIPNEVISLLTKALFVFLIWKLSYHLYLSPKKIIDKPLTNFTAKLTSSFLQFWDKSNQITWKHGVEVSKSEFYRVTIQLNGKTVLGIADPCNALELFVLYIGFLICFPASFKKFILYVIVGVAIIFVLNILRCSCMYWLVVHQNKWADFAHHYAFKLVVYVTIFGGWFLYTKTLTHEKHT